MQNFVDIKTDINFYAFYLSSEKINIHFMYDEAIFAKISQTELT